MSEDSKKQLASASAEAWGCSAVCPTYGCVSEAMEGSQAEGAALAGLLAGLKPEEKHTLFQINMEEETGLLSSM